jgi:hypothetical protein
VHNPQTNRTIGYLWRAGLNKDTKGGKNYGRIDARQEFVEFKDTTLDTDSAALIQLQLVNDDPGVSVDSFNNHVLGIIQNRFVFSQVQFTHL